MLLNKLDWRGPLLLAIFLNSPAGAIAGATEIAAIGPVERVSCSGASFQLLGITFRATTASAKSVICSWNLGSGLHYVVASGAQDLKGNAVASRVRELPADTYVPGASIVFLRGNVSTVSAVTGEFQIAGSRVLSPSGEVPIRNAAVEVIGTQPLPGGVLIADAIYLSETGAQGSENQIAEAIIGTGSSTDAIIGTGASASAIIGTGSAANAIIGTGTASKAIIGTGTSKSAIIGTGASFKAIIGTGASSSAIIGTGSSTNAIIGTGASSKAIIGTGKSNSAIIGTGGSTKAIIGTGSSASAIIGTGSSTNAIIGTGASAKAIIGTGKSSSAIIGTGASSDAIIGTGAASNAIIGTGAASY
jgi:hypothetical protein